MTHPHDWGQAGLSFRNGSNIQQANDEQHQVSLGERCSGGSEVSIQGCVSANA
jgi:hypothetical protein